jgi:hypothetical protein
MLHRIMWTLALTAAAACAQTTPALTTIQDTLYKADGTRFNGTVEIQWSSFQAGDTSYVATQHVTLQVSNGAFRVRLVPTTNASPGANYQITYTSSGRFQHTEVWAVPPSTAALRIRDVRVSNGVTIGSGPVVGQQVQIGDIEGLDNELLLRPMRGADFGVGRAAMINPVGQLDAVQGNLSDCVRVDGTAAPCGGGSGGFNAFVDGEVPQGVVNGANASFALVFPPAPAASLLLFRNGLLQRRNVDFQLNGNQVTFFAIAVPQPGDILLASYRFADASGAQASTLPQVLCSFVGSSTSALAASQLGQCNLPAGLLQVGDRIEVRFGVSKAGTNSAYSTLLTWGNQTILTRALTAMDVGHVGRFEFTIDATAQQWMGQNWGALAAMASTAGSATESTATGLPVRIWANLATSSSDVVSLRNLAVIRYPSAPGN